MSGRPARNDSSFMALPACVLRSAYDAGIAPLVGGDAHARILSVMDELEVPVQTVCYECRLASGDARVDVAVCLLAITAEDVDGVLGPLGRRHRDDAAWRRCLALLADWRSPRSGLRPHVPFVCLEIDQPGEAAALPAPGVSLCIDRDFFAHQLGLPGGPPRPVSELVSLAGTCYSRLRGEPIPAPCRELLEACLSADGVLAKHYSLMVSRTPASFKLDLRIDVERVAPLLERIGWPGPASAVAARIRELMPWRGAVQLNLVLHPAPSTSLEVELLTGRHEAAPGDRLALLHRLVTAGHCDPAKAEALRDAWARPLSRGVDGLIVARNWYLKVRFDGDRIAEAKSYLGLMPRVLCNPRTPLRAGPPSVGEGT
ncbi:MAG TPA: hypothetical protein VFK02_25365 [Kofleriaceae bacterium]|nr:hypothetical protein [Kofleriaceae bacterium]